MPQQWMRRVWIMVLLATSGGCIVHDQVMTLTLNPDGSGDVVLFRSNIRSTAGEEQAKIRIAEYKAAFDMRNGPEFERIRESGAHLERAVWIRDTAPMAHIIRVSFADADVLQRLFSVADNNGNILIQSAFSTLAGGGGRLSLSLRLDSSPEPSAIRDTEAWEKEKKSRALAFSEFRIALPEGRISDARGFITASDGQSALLDSIGVLSLLHAGEGKAELWIEWEEP